jgi:branched-chain amino acid transport system ATP-binding protein
MSATVLEISSLCRRFGGLVAVADVSIAVSPGAVHGLIGPNGAGKTTLLNLISGHLAPSSGKIIYKEKQIAGVPAQERASAGIRRTFQNLRLFREMTALENVMVGLHSSSSCEILHSLFRTRAQKHEEEMIDRRARAALDFVGLLPAANLVAGGLAYGHQRLLEIARAIASDPDLLLLDEPAAGLNGTEASQMIGLIRRIQAKGTTVILVEHHMEVVMRSCTRVTVLNYGRKLAEGTPAEIRSDPEVVNAYLGRDSIFARSDRAPPSEMIHASV